MHESHNTPYTETGEVDELVQQTIRLFQGDIRKQMEKETSKQSAVCELNIFLFPDFYFF
jgi:hypothetical protein